VNDIFDNDKLTACTVLTKCSELSTQYHHGLGHWVVLNLGWIYPWGKFHLPRG